MNFNKNANRLIILTIFLLIMILCVMWVGYAQKTNESKRTNGVLIYKFEKGSVLV